MSPEGLINLGYNYGTMRVGGLTLEEAQSAIRTHLSKILRNPQVTLALAQFRGLQHAAASTSSGRTAPSAWAFTARSTSPA